jgi:hypothetical protein
VIHRQPRRTWLAEVLIISTLMLLPLLFWWRLWALDPADRAVIPDGDFTDQYYPLRLFAAQELAAGCLPTWNPYLDAGQPGLADIQMGAFYPLNLLPNLVLALFGLPFTIGLLTAQVVFHFSLASLFTYLFVRRLARRTRARLPAARFAGAVAALTFTYAGYLTSFPVQQLTILETAVWLPLVLFFLDRAFHRANPWAQIILAGMALSCAILAGHPQTAMYVVYATLTYGLFQVFGDKRKTYRRARQLLLVICPVLLALALAAIQLAPSLTFIARSTRAGLDYEAVSWGFPLAEITHLLYPGYFGGSPQYVGILPLILAAAASFIQRGRRQVAFWIAVGAVALVLAFGGHTFLYNVTYLLAPGFGAVRNQERIIYLFSFSVSVLAGYGALTLVQPLPGLARKGFQRFGRGLGWLAVVFLAMTALWYFGFLQGVQQAVEINMFEGVLRHHTLLLLVLGGAVVLFTLRRTGRARRKWLMVLTLSLIGLNLFTVNWRFNLADPMPGGRFPETGLVTFLQSRPGTFRISSAGLLPGGASAGAVYQLEDITANTPLRLEAFRQFEERVGSWRLWQLLNVEYVLSSQNLDGPGLERVHREEQVRVYRVGDALPRAWIVHRTVIADDDEVAIDLLNADEFDPRATAVLSPVEGAPRLPGGVGTGSVAKIITAGPARLVVEASLDYEGLLVVSQPFYPGWRAQVDGKRSPMYRTDYLLQGVPLQAGTHRVELTYRMSPFPAVLALVTLVGCLAGLVSKRSRS